MNKINDGIHGMLPREQMDAAAAKYRDAYELKPNAPIYQREFGFYSLERWKSEGMPQDVDHKELFGYDEPGLIHDCMQTWFELADAVIAKHQQYVTLDELFIAEDICYNHGPLISPDMMREFLFPYYEKLLINIRNRQLDKDRHLYFQIDTDGYCVPVIPVYIELGMDVMSPFEVASGCDVVEIAEMYPKLIMSGGIDKRILALGKEEIDKHLEYILPRMKARGGYIPTCDHGVPEEVSYENYLYFRKKCLEHA